MLQATCYSPSAVLQPTPQQLRKLFSLTPRDGRKMRLHGTLSACTCAGGVHGQRGSLPLLCYAASVRMKLITLNPASSSVSGGRTRPCLLFKYPPESVLLRGSIKREAFCFKAELANFTHCRLRREEATEIGRVQFSELV